MEKEVILTKEGYRKLQDEYNDLLNNKRREIAERIKQSIEFGDLSENSEYDDAKNEQAFVEGRISQLKEMIVNATFIDNKKVKNGVVSIGSTVNIRDLENNKKMSFQMVGFAEADPGNHKISNESPVGKAILGKKAGQTVEVETPGGILQYKIMSISNGVQDSKTIKKTS